MIHLNLLKTFIDIAKTGSFRAAAEKNFMTQPAVSQQIRQLEQRLGAQLFERQNKKVFLTASGRIFLPYAEAILKQYEEAKSRVQETEGTVQGTLRIATIYSIGLYELQPIIRKYLLRYPKVNIHLEYHPFEKIYEMVFNRVVDFGFVAFPARRFGIISEIFFEENLVLVQSPHHPILKKKIRDLREINRVKFVAFEWGTPTRRAIDDFLRTHEVHPLILGEYDNIETLKSAIDVGMGCSIVPKNTIQQELKEHSLGIVPAKITLKRPLGILYPKRKAFTKCTRTFYETVMKHTKR